MAAMAAGACRCSGKAMITASISFSFFNKSLPIAVDLDVLACFVLALPAVLFHQSATDLVGRGAVVVAVEGAMYVVGTDVGDGRDLDEAGVDGAQQTRYLRHRCPKRRRAGACRPSYRSRSSTDPVPLPEAIFCSMPFCEEIASEQRAADGRVEVLLADGFLFGSQIHRVYAL